MDNNGLTRMRHRACVT